MNGMKRLPNRWAKHMLTLPESGMGFQVVVLTMKDGTEHRNVIVTGTENIHTDVNLADIQSIEMDNDFERWTDEGRELVI